MFQKIANILSIVSFVLVSSVIGGSYFGYKYVTSEQFKTKMLNEVVGNVKDILPGVMKKTMPDISGPSIPINPLKR